LDTSQQQNLKLKTKLKLIKASTTAKSDAECQTEEEPTTRVREEDDRQHHRDTDSPVNLEAQLKFCHDECEKVVVKLLQLKTQNETLNNKIKSIKSSMIVV
jgi:hypothetical protein